MEEIDRDARWQALLAAQAEVAQDDGQATGASGRGTSRRRHPSRRAARFDEALSGWAGWSEVEAPDRRLSA
jgi:hypothetical protein